ncbi:MAG: tRNA (adenosine(37)-N6)-threonylcarbamoyltransferase complex dimerization subunit type 1 TsaB [Nitrospirae bacterium]|nr:tRNA (adenosine(37)-N6)-threonylcarbamoyltransferase complex dimerization subunit type 1 TsaB [Nitrospirota bacterium]
MPVTRMRILSIDTSGAVCGAAVVDSAAGLLSSASVNTDAVKSTHSAYLMAVIDFILNEAAVDIGAMDAFAVVVGPGSFTGLRVGIATVNGLCYATGKPAVAVSSLEALAWNFPFAADPVCTILDARQGEVYGAVFQWSDGGFNTIVTPQLFGIPDSLLLLRALNEGRVIFTGGGLAVHKSAITAALGDAAIFPTATHVSPCVVGTLGLKMAQRGEFASELRPLYIRVPLAVERLQSVGG